MRLDIFERVEKHFEMLGYFKAYKVLQSRGDFKQAKLIKSEFMKNNPK